MLLRISFLMSSLLIFSASASQQTPHERALDAEKRNPQSRLSPQGSGLPADVGGMISQYVKPTEFICPPNPDSFSFTHEGREFTYDPQATQHAHPKSPSYYADQRNSLKNYLKDGKYYNASSINLSPDMMALYPDKIVCSYHGYNNEQGIQGRMDHSYIYTFSAKISPPIEPSRCSLDLLNAPRGSYSAKDNYFIAHGKNVKVLYDSRPAPSASAASAASSSQAETPEEKKAEPGSK